MSAKIPFIHENALKAPRSVLEEIQTGAKLSEEQADNFIANLKGYINDSALKICVDMHYRRHFFGKSEIQYELQAAICVIHEKWQREGNDALGDDEKTMIAYKLAEGLEHCIGGFYNRLVQILLFLQNEFTIAHILQNMRRTLVLSAAYHFNNEVHTNNAFLKAAADSYGVDGNKKDKTSVQISRQEMLARIDSIMMAKYQPLSILQHVIEEFEAKLRSEYAYKGKCEVDGYAFSICQNILKCLQEFLCLESEISFTKVFLIEETDDEITYKTTDIHWPYVRFLLYQHLNSHFFTIPPNVEKCLVYLLNPETPYNASFDLNALWGEKFINNKKKLTILLNHTSGEAKQRQMYDAYIARVFQDQIISTASENPNAFVQIDFQEATNNISRQLLVDIVKPLSPTEQARLCNQNQTALRTLLSLLEGRSYYQRMFLLAFLISLHDAHARAKTIINLYDAKSSHALRGLLKKHFKSHVPGVELEDWMHALEQAQAKHVQYYLSYLAFSSASHQQALLKAVNNKGANSLKLALDNLPVYIVQKVLDAMARLPPALQLDILIQPDQTRQNALMTSDREKRALIHAFYADVVQKVEGRYLDALILDNFHSIAAPFHASVASLDKPSQLEFILHAKMRGLNALMTAVMIRQTLLPSLLTVVARLAGAEQVRLLTQTDPKGRHALMLALCKNPEWLAPLLAIIHNMSRSDRARIFLQRDLRGRNSLMIAAYKNTDLIPLLLSEIRDLDRADQAEIFQQHTRGGWTALMVTARKNASDVLTAMLSCVLDLECTGQAVICTQTQPKGWNILMFILRYCPDAMEPAFDIIKKLCWQNQVTVLEQTDSMGEYPLHIAACQFKDRTKANRLKIESLCAFIGSLESFVQASVLEYAATNKNILMHAILHYPNFILPLLHVIGNLPRRDKTPVLTSVMAVDGRAMWSIDTWNCLMLAARYRASAVPYLIEAIAGLERKDRIYMFEKTSYKRLNALMLASVYQPKAVVPLLEGMKTLPLQHRWNILKQEASNNAENALMRAACHNKFVIGPLLEAMEPLTIKKQIAIMTQQNNDGFNAIPLEKCGMAGRPSLIACYYQFLTGSPVKNRVKGISLVLQYAKALKYLHTSLTMDPDVVLAALKNDDAAFQFASGALRTNVYLMHIAQTRDTSTRLEMIENYVQTSDYKKDKIIAELEKYALELQHKASGQQVRHHGLFGNIMARKADKNLIQRASIARIIRRLQGEDLIFDSNDRKLMRQSKIKRILGNDLDINVFFLDTIPSRTSPTQYSRMPF